ncbi:regulatory protein RecX [Acinetobacter sp. C_4_1]|uniref:regulatory protein RecX n=1 Tax=unclassified Acinetobacter TaxID=196816 RepID=UPI0021B762BB|nr:MULTISPECIES: regulatory protein RecX [unclassified Acinetobacter]MCT8089151.1 regulatory protein RecX [Acinetobacter sp. F_3_1]MCT8097306.1 regulatory protein RecX [Acinetobacter sp. C_3_1]MCT8100182.1 regulatory protein RecX [Acinetobacter sp. C_4_1]MCT8133372.1 regulatory protein RecX [Acinetobacter sp. T_3_1]
MSNPKFPNMLDYAALKQQFDESPGELPVCSNPSQDSDALHFETETQPKPQGLTGTRLRSYAFAVLTRKEYSKADLIEKLALYALDRGEVLKLVDELAKENYQSDQRVAETLLSSQKRKGKGPNRIKMALKSKKIDSSLIQDELKETDWNEQAYQLKVKKFGLEVEKEPKLKAKQIRFLMYRGFEMDAIMQAISRKAED